MLRYLFSIEGVSTSALFFKVHLNYFLNKSTTSFCEESIDIGTTFLAEFDTSSSKGTVKRTCKYSLLCLIFSMLGSNTTYKVKIRIKIFVLASFIVHNLVDALHTNGKTKKIFID